MIVDLSCGSGLFARRFANSNKYKHVVAVDYSENMLKQCKEFCSSEGGVPDGMLSLVRADVARLPFESGRYVRS